MIADESVSNVESVIGKYLRGARLGMIDLQNNSILSAVYKQQDSSPFVNRAQQRAKVARYGSRESDDSSTESDVGTSNATSRKKESIGAFKAKLSRLQQNKENLEDKMRKSVTSLRSRH